MGRLCARLAVALILVSAMPGFAKNPPKLQGPKPPRDTSGKPQDDGYVPPPHTGGLFPWQPGMDASRLPREAVHASLSSAPVGVASDSLTPATSAVGPSLQWVNNIEVSNSSGDPDFEVSTMPLTISGVEYVANAWMTSANGGMLPFAIRTSRYVTSTSDTTRSTLPTPTGYTECGDPVLAGNPYGAGQRAYGMYLADVCYYRSPGGTTGNPQTVFVWISSNAGGLWEGRTSVATTTDVDTPGIFLDKPVIDVSWYSQSLGYVYVSYVEWHNANPAQNKVILRRSTNGVTKRCRPTGGGCIDPFDAPVEVATGVDAGNLVRPQVVVNSSNGNVYVLYVSGYTGAIYMKKSTDKGVTFGPQIRISTATGTLDHNLSQTGARAFTVPTARYNPVTHKLMLVWHQELSASDTDVYYTVFDPDTASGTTVFTVKRIVQPYEQWSPSVDNDDSGNALISYYDNSEGAGWTFRQMGLYVDANANKVSTVSPNPAALNASGAGALNPSNVFGEYHDLVFWGTKWRAPVVRSLVPNCTCAAEATVVEVK